MGLQNLGTHANMCQVAANASTSQSAATVCSKFPILEEDFCKQVMIQMAEAVLNSKLSKDAAASFLDAARNNLKFLGDLWSSPG